MIEIIKDIVLLVIGGIVTTTIFYIRRRAEQKPIFEKIDKADKLLALKEKIGKSNYDLDDLKHLESVLMGRAETAIKLSNTFINDAKIFEEINSKGTHLTQEELNISAFEAYERADLLLNQVIENLKNYYSPKEIKEFNKLHKLWKIFQKNNAEFIALKYEGGSIQPLIYSSTIESTTIARIVELKAELENLSETIVPYNEI